MQCVVLLCCNKSLVADLLLVQRMFSFFRKDSSESKVSKKHANEGKKERLASVKMLVKLWAWYTVVAWFDLSFFQTALCRLSVHEELAFIYSDKWICLRIKQMFPFVRNDSSDSKPSPPKKPTVDVKKEKHRCAGALYIALWFTPLCLTNTSVYLILQHGFSVTTLHLFCCRKDSCDSKPGQPVKRQSTDSKPDR